MEEPENLSLFEKAALYKEERNKRMDICNACEFLNKSNFCKICKCYMPVKTWVMNETCPISKWSPLNKE